jgi:hypothetical protein
MLSSYEDAEALAAVQAPPPVEQHLPLVQIDSQIETRMESRAASEAASQATR